MLYRLRTKRQTQRFNRQIGAILNTPPIILRDAPFAIVSMVGKSHIPMYLLSLKSFYRAVGQGKVVAIIDRDTPEASRDLLRRHVVGIELVILEDIDTGACQRGGTWERLIYVVRRAGTEYCVQLDADLLTVADRLDDVLDCIDRNISFAMADDFNRIEPMLAAADHAKATPGDYVGLQLERRLADYPGAERLKYVRASSGFAGFSTNGISVSALEDFHRVMSTLMGADRFRGWGTEQCGSNFAVANSARALILPYPDYASYAPLLPVERVKLFHFIGSVRHRDGYYAARGQEMIAQLQNLPAPPSPRGPMLTPRHFWRAMTPLSFGRYLLWRITGRPVVLRFPGYGAVTLADPSDERQARAVFADLCLQTPIKIAPQRAERIVDLAFGSTAAAQFWLHSYPRATIFTPFPTEPGGRLIALDPGASLSGLPAGRIDILCLADRPETRSLITAACFPDGDILSILLVLRAGDDDAQFFWQQGLTDLGYRCEPAIERRDHALLWAFQRRPSSPHD